MSKLLSEDDNSVDEFDESDEDESIVSISQASMQEEEYCEEAVEKSTIEKVGEIIVNKLNLQEAVKTFKSLWPDFDKMLTVQNCIFITFLLFLLFQLNIRVVVICLLYSIMILLYLAA